MEALRNRERAGHFEWHVANEESVCGPLLLNANNPFDLEDLAQHAMDRGEKYLVRLGALGPWVSVGVGESPVANWYVRHRSDKWQVLDRGPQTALPWKPKVAKSAGERREDSSCLAETWHRLPHTALCFQVAFVVCCCAPALRCPEILYKDDLLSVTQLSGIQVTPDKLNVWTLNEKILLLVDATDQKRILYFEPNADFRLEDLVIQHLQPHLGGYEWWRMITSNQSLQFPPETLPPVSYLLHAIAAPKSPEKLKMHINQVFPASLFKNPFLRDLNIVTESILKLEESE